MSRCRDPVNDGDHPKDAWLRGQFPGADPAVPEYAPTPSLSVCGWEEGTRRWGPGVTLETPGCDENSQPWNNSVLRAFLVTFLADAPGVEGRAGHPVAPWRTACTGLIPTPFCGGFGGLSQ